MSVEDDGLLATYTQGAAETLDYQIDWSDQATLDGKDVQVSTWAVASGPAVLGDGTNSVDAPSLSSNLSTVWVKSGEAKKTSYLRNTVEIGTGTGKRVYRRRIKIIFDAR